MAARGKRAGAEGVEEEEDLPLMTASPNLLREMQDFFLTQCSTIHNLGEEDEEEETKEARVRGAKSNGIRVECETPVKLAGAGEAEKQRSANGQSKIGNSEGRIKAAREREEMID